MPEKVTPEVASTPGRPATIACAFCDSTDTELIAMFGQNLLSSQYYCRNCRSVFEAVRWTAEVQGARLLVTCRMWAPRGSRPSCDLPCRIEPVSWSPRVACVRCSYHEVLDITLFDSLVAACPRCGVNLATLALNGRPAALWIDADRMALRRAEQPAHGVPGCPLRRGGEAWVK